MRCLPSSSSSHTHSCVWWCVYLACVCVSSVVVSFPRLFWLVDGSGWLPLPPVRVCASRQRRKEAEGSIGLAQVGHQGRVKWREGNGVTYHNHPMDKSNKTRVQHCTLYTHTKHKFNAHAMEMWRVLSPWNTRVKLSFWCWKAVGRKKVGLARHVWRDTHAPDDRDRGMWG
jgi:hypothetical protein